MNLNDQVRHKKSLATGHIKKLSLCGTIATIEQRHLPKIRTCRGDLKSPVFISRTKNLTLLKLTSGKTNMHNPLECLTCGTAWTIEEVRALFRFFKIVIDCCDLAAMKSCPKCEVNP